MPRPLRLQPVSLVWLLSGTSAVMAQSDPLVDPAPRWSTSLRQSASWTESADPSWAHTTSLKTRREVDSDPAFLTDIHAGVDVLGADFQFDSLWGVQPTAGISAGLEGIDARLDAWALYTEEEWSDAGASLDLTHELLDEGELSLEAFALGSISENSGSEAGVGLRYGLWSSSFNLDASLSASRLFDADISSVTRVTGKRAVTTNPVGDQWAFRFEPGAGVRIGNGGIGVDLPMAALRSEFATTSMKKGSVTKAQWAFDAAPSGYVHHALGPVFLRASYGLQITSVLGSKSEDSDPTGWATVSASYRF